jgi:hypothetical protein
MRDMTTQETRSAGPELGLGEGLGPGLGLGEGLGPELGLGELEELAW